LLYTKAAGAFMPVNKHDTKISIVYFWLFCNCDFGHAFVLGYRRSQQYFRISSSPNSLIIINFHALSHFSLMCGFSIGYCKPLLISPIAVATCDEFLLADDQTHHKLAASMLLADLSSISGHTFSPRLSIGVSQ
jgi:hypothetical protein